MLKWIKQRLCKHDYKLLSKHRWSQQNLWQCSKCKVYYIEHFGIGTGYKTNIIITTGFDVKEK